jgi:hypothetical protein
MSLKSEINAAIASHSMWKSRLERAIEAGVFDVPADMVAKDTECYFGKWLYGESITAAIRATEEYQRIKEDHAKFHRIAARVVELAISGDKAEAVKLMGPRGEYTTTTTQLVKELEDWASKVTDL